jgi:hypothetical protein
MEAGCVRKLVREADERVVFMQRTFPGCTSQQHPPPTLFRSGKWLQRVVEERGDPPGDRAQLNGDCGCGAGNWEREIVGEGWGGIVAASAVRRFGALVGGAIRLPRRVEHRLTMNPARHGEKLCQLQFWRSFASNDYHNAKMNTRAHYHFDY